MLHAGPHLITVIHSKERTACAFHGIQFISGLMQEKRNAIANALQLRLSCTNPSICEKWTSLGPSNEMDYGVLHVDFRLQFVSLSRYGTEHFMTWGRVTDQISIVLRYMSNDVISQSAWLGLFRLLDLFPSLTTPVFFRIILSKHWLHP